MTTVADLLDEYVSLLVFDLVCPPMARKSS